MIRRVSMFVAAAILLAGSVPNATAQYRSGPINAGPTYGGGGPSLFIGAYAPPYNSSYLAGGAGFGSTYIGAVPYATGGSSISIAPPNAMIYPYAFSNGVVYPGNSGTVAKTQQPLVKPLAPLDGTHGTVDGGMLSTTWAATGRAHFTVKVPADAKVWVNDVETKQPGAVRRFHTPATLEAFKPYEYTFRAQWMENNQPVTRDRTIRFKAGDDLPVDFTEAMAR
jgi:uncharacterized protein (TIGR03000 family)